VDIVKYLLQFAMLGSSWVMYLLLGLSVFSIGTMIERAIYFYRKGSDGDELGDQLCDFLEQGEKEKAQKLLRQSKTVEAEVLRASLRWAVGGPETLQAAIDGEMTKRRRDLERGMTFLGTLGNNAPFIGLLGTVIGVIVAFADLGEGSGSAQIGKVMSGIAEALVATGVGLFVAIPAVVGFNIFQKRIGDIEDNVASINRRLCAFVGVGRPAEEPLTPMEITKNVLKAAESVRNMAQKAEVEAEAQAHAEAQAEAKTEATPATTNGHDGTPAAED
jgi:biopolymer transport protein ExbB/biopolymer transport protein TolQ